jgi:NAD(P)-dependent dehydrogenase (short-subunit alcohol dehydrogenase family)
MSSLPTMPNSSVYAATKAGLLSLARTSRASFCRSGTRVNAVSPGPIATPFHAKLGMGDTEIADCRDADLSMC